MKATQYETGKGRLLFYHSCHYWNLIFLAAQYLFVWYMLPCTVCIIFTSLLITAVWCMFCDRAILSELREHSEAWPFLTPVNTKQFPTYRKVIRCPIDFQTIGRKLKTNTYEFLTVIVSCHVDLTLIILTFCILILPLLTVLCLLLMLCQVHVITECWSCTDVLKFIQWLIVSVYRVS